MRENIKLGLVSVLCIVTIGCGIGLWVTPHTDKVLEEFKKIDQEYEEKGSYQYYDVDNDKEKEINFKLADWRGYSFEYMTGFSVNDYIYYLKEETKAITDDNTMIHVLAAVDYYRRNWAYDKDYEYKYGQDERTEDEITNSRDKFCQLFKGIAVKISNMTDKNIGGLLDYHIDCVGMDYNYYPEYYWTKEEIKIDSFEGMYQILSGEYWMNKTLNVLNIEQDRMICDKIEVYVSDNDYGVFYSKINGVSDECVDWGYRIKITGSRDELKECYKEACGWYEEYLTNSKKE